MTIAAPRPPNGLEQLHALDFHLDEVEVLRPGLDFRKGHLYMTLPMPRDERKTVGKGKDAKEIVQRVTTTVCIRSSGPLDKHPAVFPYDEESVIQHGFTFPQTFTQASENRWPRASLEAFLQSEDAAVDPATLFEELRSIYMTHVEYPEDIYYDLIPLFVMGSYLFRLFPATGYIHFNGTAASGKSQNMNILSAFALNTVWASNMTPSSLFRTVSGNPGLVCVDEAEAEHWKTEKGQELRQILLAGYTDGSTVTRTEKGPNDRFITVHYEVYSPKILASISPLDPVLQSRCIVVPMQKALRTVPEFDPKKPDYAITRGRLYTWAFQNYPEIVELREQWRKDRDTRAPEIRSRAWQIAEIYLVMAEHIGGAVLANRLVTFFNEYFARANKVREDSDLQLTLLKALPRVLATTSAHPGNFYAIKDIHEVVSSYIEEDSKDYYKTRTVSRHLVTLGFAKTQTAKGGKQVQITESVVRTAFERHKVTPFIEDEDWLAGQRTYQHEQAERPHEDSRLDHLFSEFDAL